MAWKKLTFVVIPHSQDNVKQFRIHKVTLYSICVFLVAAICIMTFYIMGFKGKEFNRERTRGLIEKSEVLQNQLAVLDTSLVTLNERIAHLESLNASIIQESGISEMDLERFGDISLADALNDEDLNPDKILAVISRLDKESKAFHHNFSSLFEECEKKPDFLRCVPSIRPSRGTITREFGISRETLSVTGQKSHQGLDITWEEGTPVVATADGVVEVVATTKELGRHIIIDHENGYKTRYAHLQTITQMTNKIRLKKGEKVKRGQQIGTIGRTGISITATPSHIMYSIYHHGLPVNPVDYFLTSDAVALGGREETPAEPDQALHVE